MVGDKATETRQGFPPTVTVALLENPLPEIDNKVPPAVVPVVGVTAEARGSMSASPETERTQPDNAAETAKGKTQAN